MAMGESMLVNRMLASTDPEEVRNTGNDQYKKGNFAEALSLYDRCIYVHCTEIRCSQIRTSRASV